MFDRLFVGCVWWEEAFTAVYVTASQSATAVVVVEGIRSILHMVALTLLLVMREHARVMELLKSPGMERRFDRVAFSSARVIGWESVAKWNIWGFNADSASITLPGLIPSLRGEEIDFVDLLNKTCDQSGQVSCVVQLKCK